MPLPVFQPLPLTRRPEPFSHPDWLFEVKYDGFRALAHLDPSGVRLISRNGNRFTSFTDLCASLEMFLRAKHAVLDGEIVCLDDQGHSQFNELLFRRGSPRFCAFDLLWLDGRDLRELPLIERKRKLRRLIPTGCEAVLYVDPKARAGGCSGWSASATWRALSPSIGSAGTRLRTTIPPG